MMIDFNPQSKTAEIKSDMTFNTTAIHTADEIKERISQLKKEAL